MPNTFHIGTLKFPNSLFMAPMEGITDIPFRKIVREHGCAVTCTQMIHAEGLLRGEQHRMKEVTAMDPAEQPVGFQLCGSDPQIMGEAVQKAQSMGAAFIDLNLGCPAKNVVKRGAGSALLQNPTLAGKVIEAACKNTSIPITIKIRAGWDNDYLGGTDVAKIAEDLGVALVSVHARTRSQKFKGKARWELIADLKSKLKIPVIGNGDIFHPDDVGRMIKVTQADGVMIARGALGNPWIFENKCPTILEVQTTLFRHMEYHYAFYPKTDWATITFRKHIVWYTKGIPNAAEFRVRVFKEKDRERVSDMLVEFFSKQDPNFVPIRNSETK